MKADPRPSLAPTSIPPVSPDAPTIGYGRYSLVSKLAEGGMASVYKAWDHNLRVWRAIKVLSQDYARRAVLRGRFETEAKTMARIDDPNVIQVYDVGTREALPYMVMELAEGGTVNHWLESHGRMPPRVAVSVVTQAARGLHAAHQLGVVHRDVKPHNLLITADAQVKVADFGIARVLLEDGEDVTRTGAAMGTIGYMAPEQKIDARSVDPRADIYGLGALLYKLVYGRIVSDLFLVEHRPAMLDTLPEPLREIVLTACYHDRERRYEDAPQMIRALKAAIPLLPDTPPSTPSLVMPMLASMRDFTAGFPEISPLIGTERKLSPIPLPYTMPRPVRSRRVTQEADDAPSYLVSPPPAPRAFPSVAPDLLPSNTIVPDGRPTPTEASRHDAEPTVVEASLIENRSIRVTLSGVTFALTILFLLTVGLTGFGAWTVNVRQEDMAQARAVLVQSVVHERSLLQDLSSRGANRADLAQLAERYQAFEDAADDVARGVEAERYVAALKEITPRVLSGEGSTSMVLMKVRNLERALEAYTIADQRLISASSGLPGRLALATGLD